MSRRRSLCTPIPAIFAAAEKLLHAVDRHTAGDFLGTEESLIEANDKAVWNYTDQAWGHGAAARYGFIKCAESPPHLSLADRPTPRMPSAATRKAALARDGHHCRFCGIPVIDPAVRRRIQAVYPAAVSWGSTNGSQHAAFQCMWLQFDHILPNGRGGDSLIDNIVITCAACNFGRMDATLEEAHLIHPLTLDPPVAWARYAEWDGLERFKSTVSGSDFRPSV